MADKSTTVKEVPANPNAIEWPSDPMGITSMFKKEAVRATGRVNGHKDKLRLLIDTIDVVREHAIARYKSQVEINNQTSKAAVDRAEEEARRAEKTRQDAIKKAEQELARLEAAAPVEPTEEDNG